MTISIWRYSHFALAISSFIFILLATVTGIVLAFEPISNQLKPYAITNADDIKLSTVITSLQDEYDEIVSVEVDNNNFVKASVFTFEGDSETFYLDPNTGKKLGELEKKAPIFEFATNLHRSLFLKSTGRFLVGLFSFLLLLIAITGIQLIVKRQGGLKKFFNKVVKENFEQYYHVVLGRWFLIPIVIITLTGVYLSLEKFDMLPASKMEHTETVEQQSKEKLKLSQFKIFNDTHLDELVTLDFPFSEDEEDYFILQTTSGEFYINQYTGNVLSEAKKPLVSQLSYWSLILHTGQGTIVWAVVLLLTCFAILFFMYSGFAMSFKRLAKGSKVKNKFTKDTAEYIILIGSETGHTNKFAHQFYNALVEAGKTVYFSTLNQYDSYKEAKHIIIFTSTYGEGEAPLTAKNFEKILPSIQQTNSIKYSVVGFGSLMYPDYCKYAIEVDERLHNHPNFEQNLPVFKINNQSFEAFKNWVIEWNEATNQDLKVVLTKPLVNRKKLKSFKVISNSGLNIDDTFLIKLRPEKKLKFQSGDIVSFYPEDDNIERQYSIAKVDDSILLSVKKHEFGKCSTLLSQLLIGDTIEGKVNRNLDFHFPSYAKEVVMIANGTGIAPFLGMLNETNKDIKTHLFWGGRTTASLQLYTSHIENATQKGYLDNFNVAYSQEQEAKVYVQDSIKASEMLISNALKNDGVIMICGSIAMQNRVLEVLNTITTTILNEPLSTFENNEQILMDCY